MNIRYEFVPNADRTDPRDMSRPWGRLIAKWNHATSVVEVALWPDGPHILKVPARRTNMGATVTAAQLAELARVVQSVAELCADRDVTHRHVIEEIAAQLPPRLAGPLFPGAGEPFADWDQA